MRYVNPTLCLVIFPLAAMVAVTQTASGQGSETESQRRMAQQMAEWIDTVWDQEPDAGMANIRLLLKQDGRPLGGKISIHTEFSFRAVGRRTSTQGFNPNANGRWVFEGLEPGEYQLHVVGSGSFAGFTWSQAVTVTAGDKPIFDLRVPG